MYTAKPYPGKFEGNGSQMLAEAVYNASMDGSAGFFGDGQTYNFYCLIEGKHYMFILCEDSQGFVTVDYGKPDEMLPEWGRIEAEYSEYCEDNPEE